MAYSKNAQKRYDEKCKNVTIRYNQSDMSVYNILNKYLTDNNISFNGYFKQLALNDLKSKGLIESE